MDLFIIVFVVVVALGTWAIFWSIQRGFNQVIAGLQSIDQRLSESQKT